MHKEYFVMQGLWLSAIIELCLVLKAIYGDTFEQILTTSYALEPSTKHQSYIFH